MWDAQKFARRYAKVIMGGLTAIMAVSLVMWTPAANPGASDGGDVVGTLFQDQKVTRAELSSLMDPGVLFHQLEWFGNQNNLFQFAYMRKGPPNLKRAEIEKKAWEMLLLLELAKRHQITVSEEEVRERTTPFLSMMSNVFRMDLRTGTEEERKSKYEQLIYAVFRITSSQYDFNIPRVVLAQKTLEYLSQSRFISWDKVYSRMFDVDRKCRVRVTPFDPSTMTEHIKPVPASRIAEYYKNNKKTFEVPAKVNVEYLFVSLEDCLERVEDPSEDELKAYYEENKRAFPKPTPEGEEATPPGDVPPEEQYLTFEEARPDVYDRVREVAAQEEARKICQIVNLRVGEAIEKAGEDFSKVRLETLAAGMKNEGLPVRNGITTGFAQKDAGEVEEEEGFGKGSNLGDWAFLEENTLHAVSNVFETDKGCGLFQLVKRKDAYDPGVTREIEGRIKKVLMKEQLKDRAQEEARKVKELIERQGFSAVAADHNMEWETSDYFPFQPRQRGGGAPTGLEDPGWGGILTGNQELFRMVMENPPSVHACAVVSGEGLDPKKSRLTYLVYLDDVCTVDPSESDISFGDAHRALNRQHRQEQSRTILEQYKKMYLVLASEKTENKSDEKGEGKKPDVKD